MNDSVQKRGAFQAIEVPSRSNKQSSFCRAVDNLLRDGVPARSIVVLVDSLPASSLSYRILNRSGKCRSKSLLFSTTYDFLQSLLPPATRIAASIRQTLASECIDLFESYGLPVTSHGNPDHMVIDHPDHPFTEAYLAGLERLGARHPYLSLDYLKLPAGVQHVFHYDLLSKPEPLRCWFLSAAASGVNIWSFPPPPRRHLPRRGPVVRSFSSENWRRDALLEAATSGHYRFIVFERSEDLRRFHLSSLCFANLSPMVASPSILYSPTIRVLFAFLDWLSAGSMGAVDTLFSMLGGRKSQWCKVARSAGLPVDLTHAVRCSLTDLSDRADPTVQLVDSLSTLRLEFSTANELEQVAVLDRYLRNHLPSDLLTDLEFVVSFLHSSALSLPEFYLALSRAWSLPPSDALHLIGPGDEEVLFDSEWLFVPRTDYVRGVLNSFSVSPIRSPTVYSLQEGRANV